MSAIYITKKNILVSNKAIQKNVDFIENVDLY